MGQATLDFMMAYMQTMLTSIATLSTPTFSMGLMEEIRLLPRILADSIGGIPWVLDTFGFGYLVGMG